MNDLIYNLLHTILDGRVRYMWPHRPGKVWTDQHGLNHDPPQPIPGAPRRDPNLGDTYLYDGYYIRFCH